MDIQDIKKRYEGAYIEDYGDYEIVHIDKRDLDWLIEEVTKLNSLINQSWGKSAREALNSQTEK